MKTTSAAQKNAALNASIFVAPIPAIGRYILVA
jgi:hypothetical protein